VEEWRDGVLLSVNTRDFQFNVAPCEAISESVPGNFTAAEPCQSLTYNFENQSNPAYNFFWDFGDPNSATDFSTEFSPSYTYTEPGTYEVLLITNPGFFCSDTQTVVLEAYLGPSVQISQTDFECVGGIEFYDFELGGSYSPEAEIVWDLGPNADPPEVSGPTASGVSFGDAGPQEIVVNVSDSGCDGSGTLIFDVPEAPVVGIVPQELFCNGLSYSFDSQESENIASLLWDFGVSGTDSDQSNGANPTFTFPAPGVYTVTLTGSGPNVCPMVVTESFEIFPLLSPSIAPIPVQCFDNHSIDFQLEGTYSSAASISWDF
jgi:PKD repeat protein